MRLATLALFAVAVLASGAAASGLFNTHPPVRRVWIPPDSFCNNPAASNYPYEIPLDRPELVMFAGGKVRHVYGRVETGTAVCVAWGKDDEPKYLRLRCPGGVLSGPAIDLVANAKWLPCTGVSADFSK